MINEDRPTSHAWHIEIQHFAIQEWCKQGDLIMEHLSGLLNPSNDLTKALSWVLHSRHACHSMGHCQIGSLDLTSAASPLLAPSARVESTEAREGVGAQIMGPTLSGTGEVLDTGKDTALGSD